MQKRYRIYLFPLFILATLLVAMLGIHPVFAQGHTQQASSQKAVPLTCGTWSVVTSPNVGTSTNELSSVVAISTSNVWAVGYDFNNSTVAFQTLIEHWNGTKWKVVPSPNVSSSDNYLYGVTAISASNIWAVGYYHNNVVGYQTLIEQWNGSSWNVVTSPNVISSDNYLNGVTAVSASDIWAVGYYTNHSNFTSQTLIEQWNGTSWSIVTSPNVGSESNYLNGVAAVSASNIWAVGNDGQTLIEQWNGSSWNIVTSPNVGSSFNALSSVAAVSASNIWTVGSYYNSNTTSSQTLIEQWNGSSWNVVTSPNDGSADNNLSSVAAGSASNIWAVGSYNNSNGINRTLTLQWNGTSWKVVTSPNVGSSFNALSGVTAVSTSNVWTVGFHNNSSSYDRTLIESYC